VKPFEALELLARVEAVLRRIKPVKEKFTIENTVIYLDEHLVTVDSLPI